MSTYRRPNLLTPSHNLTLEFTYELTKVVKEFKKFLNMASKHPLFTTFT